MKLSRCGKSFAMPKHSKRIAITIIAVARVRCGAYSETNRDALLNEFVSIFANSVRNWQHERDRVRVSLVCFYLWLLKFWLNPLLIHKHTTTIIRDIARCSAAAIVARVCVSPCPHTHISVYVVLWWFANNGEIAKY